MGAQSYTVEDTLFKYAVQGGVATIIGFNDSITHAMGPYAIVIPSTINGLPVVKIGRDAFVYSTVENVEVSSVVIPSSISVIEQGAFANQSGLTTLTLNEGIKYIDEHAFLNTYYLQDITIPNSCLSIKLSAFDCYREGYANVNTTVVIGTGIQNISNFAFAGRNGAGGRSFTINATMPPPQHDIFTNNYDFTIYVPSASVDTYKSIWFNYADYIQAIS